LVRGVLVLVFGLAVSGFGVVLAFLASPLSLAISTPLLLSSLVLTSLGLHYSVAAAIYTLRSLRGPAVWPCGCPACSLVASRVTNSNEALQAQGSELLEEDVPQLEEVEVESREESAGEAREEPRQVQQPPQDGILEALSSLEEEVKSVKGELQESIGELRAAIASLKSEVDEVRNPFNFMRSVAEFLDEETKNAILAIARMTRLEGGEGAPSRLVVEPYRLEAGVRGGDGFIDFLELLLWLDEIYGSREWVELRDLLGSLEQAGLVPESKLRRLKAAVDIVERSRSRGERVSGKIKLLYMLAKQLGVADGERGLRLLEYLSGGG